jgi:hypothetical protein
MIALCLLIIVAEFMLALIWAWYFRSEWSRLAEMRDEAICAARELQYRESIHNAKVTGLLPESRFLIRDCEGDWVEVNERAYLLALIEGMTVAEVET